jgi:hypothetical protein
MLTQYRTLLGVVSVNDFTPPFANKDLNQVNLVNAVTFPTTPRLVDDANTLDDYREGTWTPVLSSDATAPTYTDVETPVGTFTKIGNLVFCRCQMRVNITAVGTGTPRVTGLPYIPKGLEPPTFSLHTALNATPSVGSSYMISAPALLIGSPYKVIANGYLVFTVTYQVA